MSGSTKNTMKNTQIRVGQDGFEPPTSRSSRALLPCYRATVPYRQFLWRRSPSRVRACPHRLNGVPLAGRYEQISIVYAVGRCRSCFHFVNAIVKCAAHFQVMQTGLHQRLRAAGFLDVPNLITALGIPPYCSGRWPMGICPTPNPLLQWVRLIATKNGCFPKNNHFRLRHPIMSRNSAVLVPGAGVAPILRQATAHWCSWVGPRRERP